MTVNLKTYRKLRAEGINAAQSLIIARNRARAVAIPCSIPSYVGDKETFEQNGFDVTLSSEYDMYSPDYSWIGEVSWNETDNAKRISTRSGYAWIIPECNYDDERAGLLKMGYSRTESDKEARRIITYQIKRLEDFMRDEWHFIGLTVTVSKNGIELGHASLWGIESDSGEYMAEVYRELIPEAIAEARESIASLCEIAA